MQNITFYVLTVGIWGTTWFAIKLQLGVVDPMVSVAYRFILAAGLLLAYCKVAGRPIRFTPGNHATIALQGICLFSINYWLFYLSEIYLTSGLVAVIFSTLVIMNIINEALFLKRVVQKSTVLGAVVGLIGICCVFRPEIFAMEYSHQRWWGLGLGFGATYLASLGNILSAHHQRLGLGVIETNAAGMAYGALVVLLLALLLKKPFDFPFSLSYIGSLAYLALFGSVVAFGLYLTLVGRIGAAKAAYATLLFPLVALQVSAMVEGYHWNSWVLAGVALILLGNVIILKSRAGVTLQNKREHTKRPGRLVKAVCFSVKR